MAVKELLVCPKATVMLAGTVRLALLLESATANPPLSAAPVNPTEQEVVPGVLIVELPQVRPLKEGANGRVIAPEIPFEGMRTLASVDALMAVS